MKKLWGSQQICKQLTIKIYGVQALKKLQILPLDSVPWSSEYNECPSKEVLKHMSKAKLV